MISITDKTHNLNSAAAIKLLLLDVDGVLTDGSLYFSSTGEESKAFNTQDGQGIRMLLDNGIDVGIITGRSSGVVEKRAADLGIKLLFQGQKNKLAALDEIITSQQIAAENIAYAGDDFPDLAVMKAVALGIAVANAPADLHQHANLVTEASGGSGAVREITDYILKAQNKYDAYFA